MNKNTHYILLCAVILLLQTVINNHVHTHPLLFICFIPLLIIQMPLSQDAFVSLPAAFAIGLTADLLSGGVLGLNAGSAVFAAALRRPLFFICFSKGNYLREKMPAIKEVGLLKYALYTFLVIAVYFLFYILSDGFSTAQWMMMAFRLLINSVINLLLILIICFSFFNTDRR